MQRILSHRSNFEFRGSIHTSIITMYRRQDRRRKSRSPSRHARPHDSRSRSRRRSPRQGRRQPQSTSRPPTNQTQWEDIRKIPSHWKPTSDMLDYNTAYGMPLPRRVVSTSASRTLGIDNLPVHEIRLIQVLQDSSYGWCLRQVAAGKTCYLEMFKVDPLIGMFLQNQRNLPFLILNWLLYKKQLACLNNHFAQDSLAL